MHCIRPFNIFLKNNFCVYKMLFQFNQQKHSWTFLYQHCQIVLYLLKKKRESLLRSPNLRARGHSPKHLVFIKFRDILAHISMNIHQSTSSLSNFETFWPISQWIFGNFQFLLILKSIFNERIPKSRGFKKCEVWFVKWKVRLLGVGCETKCQEQGQ